MEPHVGDIEDVAGLEGGFEDLKVFEIGIVDGSVEVGEIGTIAGTWYTSILLEFEIII